MTEREPPDIDQHDEPLEDWVIDALVERQVLVPISESEVARAERDGLAFEGLLPDSLRGFAPRASLAQAPLATVVALHERRTLTRKQAWLGHGLSAVAGAAAAAAALLVWKGHYHDKSLHLAQDHNAIATFATVPAGGSVPTAIGPFAVCGTPCCAGTDCSEAKAALRQCASLRRCVSCASIASDERYRLRIGRMAPTSTGQFLLDKTPGKSLELCVRVASSPLACSKAFAGGDGEEAWVPLPLTATSADLLAGLTVQLRWVGEDDAMASWSYPIENNATVLCNGIAVKVKLPDGEVVGSLSMFLDDAYYVELGRGKSLIELGQRVAKLRFEDIRPQIYETAGSVNERFAVTIGPMGKAAAEAARYAAFVQGFEARVVNGFDYRGNALGVPKP